MSGAWWQQYQKHARDAAHLARIATTMGDLGLADALHRFGLKMMARAERERIATEPGITRDTVPQAITVYCASCLTCSALDGRREAAERFTAPGRRNRWVESHTRLAGHTALRMWEEAV
jgi:hypothetical protein